jgi:biotin operon repressor
LRRFVVTACVLEERGLTRVQLSQEQLGQLYELMHATKDIWKPVEQLQKEGGEQ